MSRWLVLAVFAISPLAVGCGSSVRAGLANAPSLGGTQVADARIHDVVSNGDEACGVYAQHGVLRNRIPPCPTWTATHPVASSLTPSSTDEASHGLVQPWLNHFYVGWPCPESASSRALRPGSPVDSSVASVANAANANECASVR